MRIAVAVHGGKAELPTVDERLAAFDAALVAEPKQDGPLDDLHRYLGVA